MLQFFKDASLTNAVTVDSPVWILAPEKGGKRRFSLWLGDNYRTLVAVQAAAGATSITVVDTSGMPTSGQFYYRDGAGLITYTGKTATTLTGIDASSSDKNLYLRTACFGSFGWYWSPMWIRGVPRKRMLSLGRKFAREGRRAQITVSRGG